MKRKTILTLLVLVMILSIIGLVACNNKEDSSNDQQEVKVETYVVTVVDGIGAGTYKKGANATVTAQNKGDGYTFIGWYSGEDFVSTQNPYTFKVTRTITLTATYSYDEYYSLSENEKDDFINDKTKEFVARNVNDTSKAFDHWNTKVEEDTTTKSILGGSEKSAKITIDPIQNSEGDYLDQSVSSGVWSTVDFGFMNKEINAFDYNYIEFDAKFSNAQKWTSVRFVDAKGNVSTELGLDARASETGKYSVLVSADGWYHFAFDIATLYDYAKLTNTDSELVPAEKTNYDVIKNAVGIRICTSLSGKDVDGKYEAIINIDNLKLNKTAQDVTALKYTVTAVDGTITDAATDNKYDKDAEITVTATDKSEQCYVFVGWSDGETIVSEDNPYTFAVTKNINLTATYEQKFTVTIVGGTETSLTVDPNATPTITATAKNGYDFTGWKKDSDETIVSTSLSYTIPAVTANVTYTAVFTAITETGDLITLATIVKTKDGAEAYNVKTTNSASVETVALKVTAEAESGYPSIIVDIGTFNMLDQKLFFNMKIVKGYPWYSFKYLDADEEILASQEGDISKNAWVEIERSEVIANAKYIQITFNADGKKPATMEEIEVYIDAMTLVDRPLTHKYAVTYKAGSAFQYDYTAISLSSLVGKALYFEYQIGTGSGTSCTIALMDGWNNATGNFALNKDGTVGKGVVKSLGDGWYGITIPYNQFSGNELKDAEELNFIYAAADKMGYDLTIDYDTFNVVSIPIITVVDGTIENATSDNAYLVGTSLKVTATDKDHKSFTGWSNGTSVVSNSNPYTFTVSENVTLTAQYADIKFTITAVDGTITNATLDNKYVEGSELTVTAATKANQFFTGWSDGSSVVSTSNPYIFTVIEDLALTAQYSTEDPTKTYYDVIVKADGETTANNRVVENGKITLTPATKSGYFFNKWVDGDGADITLTNGEYTVTGDITIVATYFTARGTSYEAGYSYNLGGISTNYGIEFDLAIVSGTKVSLALKEDDTDYYGYYDINLTDATSAGITRTYLGDGYYHFTFNMAQLTRTGTSWNLDHAPSIVNTLYFHASWTDSTGYIDNITIDRHANAFYNERKTDLTKANIISATTSQIITFEYKVRDDSATSDCKVDLMIFDGKDWNNFYGYLTVYPDPTQNAVYLNTTNLGDGWYQVSVDLLTVTKKEGIPTGTMTTIYFRGKWADCSMWFDNFQVTDGEYHRAAFYNTVGEGLTKTKLFSAATNQIISFEYKVKENTAGSDAKVNIMIFDGSDWDNYFGYFGIKANPTIGANSLYGNVDNYLYTTAIGDGWYKVYIDLSACTKASGTPSGTMTSISVRAATDWTNCSLWFDRFQVVTEIPHKNAFYNTIATDLTKKNIINASCDQIITFEYKLNQNGTGSGDQKACIMIYDGTDWDNIYGYFEIWADPTKNKSYLNTTSLGDGWYQVSIDLSTVPTYSGTPSGTMTSAFVRGKWNDCSLLFDNFQVSDPA